MRFSHTRSIVTVILFLTLTLAFSQAGLAQSVKPTPVAVLVKASEANLRDRPSLSGTITNTVEEGDLLTLVSSTPVGPWYLVRENKSAPELWIHGNAIALLYTEIVLPPPVSGKSYINVDGVRVPSPVFSETKPPGATARCRDGSYSFSQHRRGTCSGHRGVAEWF